MTINATRKIISLTGPNCSFGNTSACRVDVVAEGGYTPTVVVTNQAELNTQLAKSAAALEGQVIGVQYNATPYVINRNGTGSFSGKDVPGAGLVICQIGGTMPVFSSIEMSGCSNITLYGLELTSAATSGALLYFYTSVSDITIDSCKIHGTYYNPNGDYTSVAYPSTLRGIGWLTSASNLPLTDMTIRNNEIYDVRQGIEMNRCGGSLVITGNNIYRCYVDGIQLSNSIYTPTYTEVSWNEIHDLVALAADVGGPHGDYFQVVGASTDWPNFNIRGNIIYTGSARGSGQGIFLDDFATGFYATVYAKGNLISVRDFNRGLSIQQAKNCEVIGNTVIMSGAGQLGIAGMYVGEYSDGGGNMVKNNVCRSYTLTSSTASNNHTIAAHSSAAYSAIFDGTAWDYADIDTRSKILAAASMKVGGALDTTVNIGAVGSGYVDFTARTINGAME